VLPVNTGWKVEEARRRRGAAAEDSGGTRRGLRTEDGRRGRAGHALHRKGSDAAHPRSTLAGTLGRDGLHAPGHFPAQLCAKESQAGVQARGLRLFSAMLDRIKFDTVTTVSKIQVRSQAEIEREELERQQRLARALQMQHAEAISPIQAMPAPGDFGGGSPGGGGNVTEMEPRLSAPAAEPFVRQVPKVDATSLVPAGRGASTSTATVPCSKPAVELESAPRGSRGRGRDS